MSKILVAMSGGVDSAVSALLTLQAGHTVLGATMQLTGGDAPALSEKNACCSSEELELARAVARRLGIPHYTLPFSKEFRREVVEPFIRAYESGETPNPCIRCNRHLKFGALHTFARAEGCDLVATGHYARVTYDKAAARYLLRKATDPAKDQSYVLWSLSPEQLSHTVFPLGELSKETVRELAAAHGFENAHRAESQDICFVPDGDYAAFIRAYTGKSYPTGNFTDADGRTLGTHNGILCYTVGQRKGLGLSLGHPVFVTDIRPESNTVVVGEEAALWRTSVDLRELNLLAVDRLDAPLRCRAKIRYRQAEAEAILTQTGEETAHLEFFSPVRAPARGQSAVFYDGDILLGGGIIC